MLIPTKGIAPQRALLNLGAEVITVLAPGPLTISQTWSRLRAQREQSKNSFPVSFGWFVLALDTLYALGVLEYKGELLAVRAENA